MATYIGQIKVGNNTLPVGSTLYGTCSTAAGTAAKVVTLANFDNLTTGVTIHVKFTNSNTAANPTLNVNSTGAKTIYRYGTTAPSTTAATSWNAGAVVSFTYDGTYWQMNDWVNTDTQPTVTGVKGNAENSYRTGNVNLTAANVQAIKISESGNTQQLVRPSGLRGSSDVTLQGVFNTTRANRLAYLPADQIIIEKTTDGGSTWVDAGYTDVQKRHLFAETRGANINLPKIDNKTNLLCGLRITISAMKYNVPSGTGETSKYNYWSSTYVALQERYSQLKEFYFWVSTSNNSMSVKVERATGANPNSWSTCFNDNTYYMTGWSGSDYIRLDYQSTFGGGTNQTGNHWNYRFTFMTRGVNGTDTMGTGYETQTQTLFEIRGYGDSVWGVPNQYMAYDRIYTQDVDKNVTFPAKVTATGGFTGDVTGNVTGNVSGTATTATNVSTQGAATNSTARHVWFSDSTTETKRAHSDSLKYTPSTNTISANVSGNAANVTGTVAVDHGGTGLTSSPSMLTNLGSTTAANILSATPRPGVTGTLAVGNGGTGLTSAPSMLTNVGSTTAASIFAASPRPGVTGTLAVGNGGTGKTTAKDACNDFINALDTQGTTPVDADYLVAQYANGGTTTKTYHRKSMSTLWAYIKGKIESVVLSTSTSSSSTTTAATSSAVKSAYDLANGKQDALVSGTNIKTINNTSLLGSGNISVQNTLVSGTNIKTINNTSLLGSGNISVTVDAGTATPTANTIAKFDASSHMNSTDMATQEVEDFVDSLNFSQINAVDYVIEQQLQDTGWAYTKWNSGKLECWYKGNPGAYTIGTARGNWYSGGDLTFTYPVAFAYSPTITGNVSLGTSAYVVMFQFNGFNNTSCQGRIVAGSSIAQNSNYWIFIHAVGRWK